MVALARRGVFTTSGGPQSQLPGTSVVWVAATLHEAWLKQPGQRHGQRLHFRFCVGVVFQYFAIAPMRGLGLKDGLIAAAKADFISR